MVVALVVYFLLTSPGGAIDAIAVTAAYQIAAVPAGRTELLTTRSKSIYPSGTATGVR